MPQNAMVLFYLTVVEKKNAVVSVLFGDDDSSTISKVRQNVEHEVEKWSDVAQAAQAQNVRSFFFFFFFTLMRTLSMAYIT